MEEGESMFSPRDRIGQLTMRNLESSTRAEKKNLFTYTKAGCWPPAWGRRAAPAQGKGDK